jgi:phage terminase large subunit-like protein
VANAATQILLRQAPQAIEKVGEAFGLSAGERQWLLACGKGQGLLAAGASRVGFQAISSPSEHAACTSDPAELAELDSADLYDPYADPDDEELEAEP